ncbi:MAG: iron-containing alcohol dehydrogenase [Clostridia bacterium]|nr:iron-containing alcohol dehydrogenase [Clostridia bacterium]MBQ8792695.1 iron-containing alcohol dehydrogenase [Clostridia bacterium]
MNIFKRAYCRTYQTIFKIMIPLLPYREPKILKSNQDVALTLRDKNISRVLLVTDGGIRKLNLTSPLEETLKENNIEVFVYDKTVPNPTTDNVAQALEMYKSNSAQALIAFGGGSAMDCAKATGARVARPKKPLSKMKGVLKVGRKIPTLIAVPTTAGTGSETTLAAVITDSDTRHKYAINDFPLIPRYALLDASLTLGLPKHITSTTGMDALTHAIEAYIGRSSTKSTRKYSLEAVKALFENILEVYNNPQNIEAREQMLHASYKAGLAFTKSYVGYVHAVAHSLGGKYNVAHGLANAIILPYVLKKYGRKIYKKLWKMGVYAGLFEKATPKEVGAKIFIEHIEQLNKQMNIQSSINEIQEEDIPSLAKTAEKEANPLYPVPVLWTSKELEQIYREVKNG